MSEPKQNGEPCTDTDSNRHAGDLEKLNALAEDVKARLKGGFGDYYEDGSRGDIRHLQMPKLLQLVEKVDEVNANLRKIDHTSTSPSASSMMESSGTGSTSGGRATTAQSQTVLERLNKLTEKNTDMDQKVKDALNKAELAYKHSEATELENESLRKDVAPLEGKLKEVGRKAALPPPEQCRLDEKLEGLQGQVQAASSKAHEVEERFEALQMQISQTSSKADAAAEKAEGVRAAADNASTSRVNSGAKQDRAIQSLETKSDAFVGRVQDLEGKAQSASSKADSAYSRADAASTKAAKAHALASTISAKQDTQGPKQEETIQKLEVKCGSISDQVLDPRGKVDAASAKAETASTTAETAVTKADTALNRATSASIAANKADTAVEAISSALDTCRAEQQDAVKALNAQAPEVAGNIDSLNEHQQSNNDALTSLQSQIDTIKDNITSINTNLNAPKITNDHGVLVSNLPAGVTQALLLDYFQASSGPVLSSQKLEEDEESVNFIVHFKNVKGVGKALKFAGNKVDGRTVRVEALGKPLTTEELFAQKT